MYKDEPCNLIKKFSPKFIEMIDATSRDGREREVNFCQDNGNITLSNVCIGNKCSIPKSARESLKCKDGKPPIGGLHTHPDIDIFNMSMSPEDVATAIARGEKFACIGYRGIAKTVSCNTYPYNVPKDEADKFRDMGFFNRENKLLEDLEKHAKIINKRYYIDPDIPKENQDRMTKEANLLTESKEKIMRYASKTEQWREENACTIFLAPL